MERADRADGAMTGAETVLLVGAVTMLLFNFVSGLVHQYLKYRVLGHSTGTGVVPGPWLVVGLLAVGVPPAGLVLGAVVAAFRRGAGRTVTSVAIGCLVASALFQLLVFVAIVLDPGYSA